MSSLFMRQFLNLVHFSRSVRRDMTAKGLFTEDVKLQT